MPYAPEYLHLVFPDVTFEALLYGRNSRDPLKKGRSIEDQLVTGRDLCNRFNWPVVEEFKDTGISATRHSRKARDDFEALLDAIENYPAPANVIRICVAYEASRYYRDLEAYVRLRNACFHAGVLLCYNGTVYDLSKKDDRRATAQDAINAEDEGEGIRDRNVRTARLSAEDGGIWGKVPFGYVRKYDPDTGELIGQDEHPEHGQVVFQSLQYVDSGGSQISLRKSLQSDPKAARPDGAEWTDALVRYMLLNRAYLGERMREGKAIKAKWPPLRGLETPEGRAMFFRVTQRITDPSRANGADGRARHLVSCIALCGECGDRNLLRANSTMTTAGRRHFYQCQTRRDVSIMKSHLDAYVEEAVLTWLSRKEQARAALMPDEEGATEEAKKSQALLAVYQGELDEARSLNGQRNKEGRPLLSLTSLSQIELELLPKIEELEKNLQSATGVPLLVHQLLSEVDPQDTWNALDLNQRREAIRRIVTIRVFKARKRGRQIGIDPDRVELSFVGSAGFRDSLPRAPWSARARHRQQPEEKQ